MVYNDDQHVELEKELLQPSRPIWQKSELATDLGLTEGQLQIRFQNPWAKKGEVNKQQQQQPPPPQATTTSPRSHPQHSSASLLGATSPRPVGSYLP